MQNTRALNARRGLASDGRSGTQTLGTGRLCNSSREVTDGTVMKMLKIEEEYKNYIAFGQYVNI